jgi:hypothetical protein
VLNLSRQGAGCRALLSGNGNAAVVGGGSSAVAAAGKDLRADTAYSFPDASATVTISGCTGGKTVAAWINVDDDAFDATAVGGTSCPGSAAGDAGDVRGVWVFYAGVVTDVDTGAMSVFSGLTGESLSLVSTPNAKIKALLQAMVRRSRLTLSNPS